MTITIIEDTSYNLAEDVGDNILRASELYLDGMIKQYQPVVAKPEMVTTNGASGGTSGAKSIMQKIEVTTSRGDDLAAYTAGYDYDKLKSDPYYKEVATSQESYRTQPAVDPTEFHPQDLADKGRGGTPAKTYEDRRVARLVGEAKEREQARVETLLPHQKSPRTRTMDVDAADAEFYDPQNARRRVLKEAAQQDATEFAMSSIVPEQNPLDAMHEAEYGIEEDQKVGRLVREAKARESARVRRDARKIEGNVREEANAPREHWLTEGEKQEELNEFIESQLSRKHVKQSTIPDWPHPKRKFAETPKQSDTRAAEALANALRALKDKKFMKSMKQGL